MPLFHGKPQSGTATEMEKTTMEKTAMEIDNNVARVFKTRSGGKKEHFKGTF